ncbi:DUF3817 domain-containing protein [Pseudonocardia pini]|uniref:DUF3817 domain-containing protein n=1 Tax=Pseudonocardia pini TaxID=2758030 RepID=UPI0015F02AB4|nr:DUF3817 domain-containing protein [Pseudonocardia pini]
MAVGLRWAAALEALSLLVLLLNLLTVHLRPVTQLAGPLHGTAYLAVIALTVALTRGRARWLALVPGIGGGLVVRAMRERTEKSASHQWPR